MYWIYSVITAAGMLLLSPYFVARSLMRGESLQDLAERLGWRFPSDLRAAEPNPGTSSPPNNPGRASGRAGTIWIHAVSVGEVLAAVPLARELKTKYPARRLVVSTTTATGQRIARERMSFADAIFYFPLDWRGPVRRAFAAVRPALVIIVETEIWPNFLRHARRAAVPVIFVNGRLSERSSRGFQRAISFPGGMLRRFLKNVLNDATAFLMQADQDAARLLALGANAQKVSVAGNMKYDFGVAQATAFSDWLGAEVRSSLRHPVIVAGSVAANEEAPVLQAFAIVETQFPRALLVVAPRKPDRFDASAEIVAASQRRVIRRSALSLNGASRASGGEQAPGDTVSRPQFAQPGSVLLLDSVGELASVYAHADAVFVGGSLVPSGGHNILEPASFGKLPFFGGSMENFREMAGAFTDAGAGIQVQSAKELGEAWVSLLSNAARAESMGAAAKALVEKNRGATSRTLAQIERYLEPASDAAGSL